MSSNNFDADHLDTLDRDLGRLSSLGAATAYAARPMVGLGISFVFVVLASLLATVFFGQSNNTVIVMIAAGVGAYMALNVGANDVANNMWPAVGANALSMRAAIGIAAVFESAGALLAGVHIVKGVLARDHVHMFLSIPPKLSLTNVMQRIKGRSSRRIQLEFPELRKPY